MASCYSIVIEYEYRIILILTVLWICTIKHPELHESIEAVLESMVHPTEVRHASQDIYLYYRTLDHHALVAVARHLNGDGFLVTAYKTTKKKRKGTIVWPKRK